MTGPNILRALRGSVSVRVSDGSGKSISFTLYAGQEDLPRVVERLHADASRRWATTRLDDKRHKPR